MEFKGGINMEAIIHKCEKCGSSDLEFEKRSVGCRKCGEVIYEELCYDPVKLCENCTGEGDCLSCGYFHTKEGRKHLKITSKQANEIVRKMGCLS